ncbi:MAG TPA: FAD/NAD(P)-binding protein [Steroidobacteraceae bacterium]|nr:FAD/NAD(P)-binding protein [Steroidobacteraceae bacterium]
MRTIAIIGAGFSGTAMAVHLLRYAHTRARIVLLDDQMEMAAGLAYSPSQQDWLLNVPAAQMSLDSSRPGELVDFARQQGMRIGAQDFLSRALYGRYLCASLLDATESSRMEFARIWGRVSRLTQLHSRARSWRIDLGDGHLLFADEVVLAVGNPQPARLAALQAIRGTSWYVHDPLTSWPQDRPDRAPRRVLLLGTGLTMADVALRLALRGPEPPEILALSRHGRLPQPQTAFSRAPLLAGAVASIRASSSSLRELVRTVHALSLQANGAGGDWREVINAVRRIAPELWAALNLQDRRRFLRHVRPIWDTHRHRLPPAAAQELQRMHDGGRLTVRAGSIESANITRAGIEVVWRPRGAQQRERLVVGRIFNCTGPDYHSARSDNTLVQSLLASGLITPDPLELGIRVTDACEVIAADGRVSKGLYYVGPWLRARHWEATAVPELREHVRQLAERLGSATFDGKRRDAETARRLAVVERAVSR